MFKLKLTITALTIPPHENRPQLEKCSCSDGHTHVPEYEFREPPEKKS